MLWSVDYKNKKSGDCSLFFFVGFWWYPPFFSHLDSHANGLSLVALLSMIAFGTYDSMNRRIEWNVLLCIFFSLGILGLLINLEMRFS